MAQCKAGSATKSDRLCQLAFAQAQSGQTEQALRSYELALDADPDRVETLCLLADLHAKLGGVSAARELYERALAVEPRSLRALRNLGLAEAQVGHPYEARCDYTCIVSFENQHKRIPMIIMLAVQCKLGGGDTALLERFKHR